jgi:hypothetical protein
MQKNRMIMKEGHKSLRYLVVFVALLLQLYQTDLKACGSPKTRYSVGYDSNIMIWQDFNIFPRPIKGATIGSAGTLGASTILSLANQNCQEPQLNMTSGGDALATWLATDSNKKTYTLYAALLPNGGAWTAPITLSNSEEDVLSNSVKINIHEGQLEIYFHSITYFTNSEGKNVCKEELRLAKGTILNEWAPTMTVATIR